MFGAAQYVVHDVKAGDTLAKISNLYGVSVADIAKANMISDPNKISAGMQIMIPEIYTGTSVPSVPNTPVRTAIGIKPSSLVMKVPTSNGMLQNRPVVQTSSILGGTLFGIPKLAAYSGIALITAGLAVFLVKRKRAKAASTTIKPAGITPDM
jgi:murein DD-endopeptidase MepM/ murein hydrolase activator NlpD